jgi:hypothetical protein
VLCKQCKKINLDAIFKRQHLTKVGKPIRKLPLDREEFEKSCPLCVLIVQTFKINKEDRKRKFRLLRSLSTVRIKERGWDSINTVMLATDQNPKSAFLVPQSRKDPIIRLLEPLLSFDLVQEWLKLCIENHTKSCGQRKNSDSVSSIAGFKLIDCNTRGIVDGQGISYATLSYVWGANSGPKFSYPLHRLPEQVPNTVEDAIIAVQALGFRYLWIDRYCINQADRQEVSEQVTKMDLIYNNSELTIIAAAGDDSNYGLPGIRPRCVSQPHGRVQKHYLISSMEDPTLSIKESKWITRGWTYQEGLLSRRRLIFTDQQVYFECCGMYCCESLNLPLLAMHTQNKQRFKSTACREFDRGLFPKKLGSTGWDVITRIQEYSMRNLTQPSDILNGFMGILRTLEKDQPAFHHVFGVPVLPRPPKPTEIRDTEEATGIYESYAYSMTAGFCSGLCWNVVKPTYRRDGFPSWSWAGWQGGIEWGFDSHNWRQTQGDTSIRIDVHLQTTEGNLMSWEDYAAARQHRMIQLSPVIHLSAWVTPIEVLAYVRDRKSGVQVVSQLKLADGRPVKWRFRPTSTEKILLPIRCSGVHLSKSPRCLYLVVLTETEPGLYQRFGFGEITVNIDQSTEYLYRPTPVMEIDKSWLDLRVC